MGGRELLFIVIIAAVLALIVGFLYPWLARIKRKYVKNIEERNEKFIEEDEPLAYPKVPEEDLFEEMDQEFDKNDVGEDESDAPEEDDYIEVDEIPKKKEDRP